jgi:FtsH-binding integral membrane protein
MKRTLEWLLAGLGAIMCIGGAISIWIPQAADNPPGFSLWPMPALVLIEVALLGVVGFLGIALEPQQLSTRWGFLVWIASGALLGLSILGDFSVSVIAIFAAPALAFGGAAILADHRRKRKMLPDLGVLVGSGIANLGLFYLIALL